MHVLAGLFISLIWWLYMLHGAPYILSTNYEVVGADLIIKHYRGVPFGSALSATVWTGRDSGLDGSRPRCKSDVFHASHRTVHAIGHRTEPFAIFGVQQRGETSSLVSIHSHTI